LIRDSNEHGNCNRSFNTQTCDQLVCTDLSIVHGNNLDKLSSPAPADVNIYSDHDQAEISVQLVNTEPSIIHVNNLDNLSSPSPVDVNIDSDRNRAQNSAKLVSFIDIDISTGNEMRSLVTNVSLDNEPLCVSTPRCSRKASGSVLVAGNQYKASPSKRYIVSPFKLRVRTKSSISYSDCDKNLPTKTCEKIEN